MDHEEGADEDAHVAAAEPVHADVDELIRRLHPLRHERSEKRAGEEPQGGLPRGISHPREDQGARNHVARQDTLPDTQQGNLGPLDDGIGMGLGCHGSLSSAGLGSPGMRARIEAHAGLHVRPSRAIQLIGASPAPPIDCVTLYRGNHSSLLEPGT